MLGKLRLAKDLGFWEIGADGSARQTWRGSRTVGQLDGQAGRRADNRIGSQSVDMIHQAAALLRQASRVAVLTGAGISAESGIPTFRDALTGLWASYDAEQLATPAGVPTEPGTGLGLVRRAAGEGERGKAEPGPLCLGRTGAAGAGVHPADPERGRAPPGGGEPEGGRAARQHPPRPVRRLWASWLERWDDRASARRGVRGAEGCFGPMWSGSGSIFRPGALEAGRHAAEHCDVFLSVGTSNLVEPAASLPWHAHRHGAEVIVVNTTAEGQRSGARIHHLVGKAGEVLPALVRAAWPTDRTAS